MLSPGLGGFAGGLAGGLEGGVALADRVRRQKEEAILRAAQAAAGRSLGAGGGGGGGPPNLGALSPQPQPPMPGQPSMPAQPSGPPPPQPTMKGPGVDGNPVGTPQGPAMGPAGGAPLSGTAAPTGQSGVMGSVQDANNTIKAIAQSIKASNPDIEPRTLFLATQQTIEQMKGVRSEVKDYMYAQIELAKMQDRHQTEQEKMTERMQEQIAKLDEAMKATKERTQAQRDVAGTQADARVKAAQIGGQAREAAAASGAGARVQAAEIGAGSREKVAGTQAAARGASDATRSRTARDVARINMGKDPRTTPPVPGARRANDGNWYVKQNGKFYRVEPGE